MNLVSCDECGVVVDSNKCKFPNTIHNTEGEVDLEKADWDGFEYVPKIKCPVCSSDILKGA